MFVHVRSTGALLLLAAGLLMAAAGSANACICAKEPRKTVIEAADVVFIGNPIGIATFKQGKHDWEKTTFRVSKWIKGGGNKKRSAVIHMRLSKCDVRFREGTGPFTVAAFVDHKGRFTTNRCIMLNIHRDQ